MLGLQHVTPPFNLEGSLLKELCIKVQEGFRRQPRVSDIVSHSYSGITGICNSGDQSNIDRTAWQGPVGCGGDILSESWENARPYSLRCLHSLLLLLPSIDQIPQEARGQRSHWCIGCGSACWGSEWDGTWVQRSYGTEAQSHLSRFWELEVGSASGQTQGADIPDLVT